MISYIIFVIFKAERESMSQMPCLSIDVIEKSQITHER